MIRWASVGQRRYLCALFISSMINNPSPALGLDILSYDFDRSTACGQKAIALRPKGTVPQKTLYPGEFLLYQATRSRFVSTYEIGHIDVRGGSDQDMHMIDVMIPLLGFHAVHSTYS